jgi:hypothetical protein
MTTADVIVVLGTASPTSAAHWAAVNACAGSARRPTSSMSSPSTRMVLIPSAFAPLFVG